MTFKFRQLHDYPREKITQAGPWLMEFARHAKPGIIVGLDKEGRGAVRVFQAFHDVHNPNAPKPPVFFINPHTFGHRTETPGLENRFTKEDLRFLYPDLARYLEQHPKARVLVLDDVVSKLSEKHGSKKLANEILQTMGARNVFFASLANLSFESNDPRTYGHEGRNFTGGSAGHDFRYGWKPEALRIEEQTRSLQLPHNREAKAVVSTELPENEHSAQLDAELRELALQAKKERDWRVKPDDLAVFRYRLIEAQALGKHGTKDKFPQSTNRKLLSLRKVWLPEATEP